MSEALKVILVGGVHEVIELCESSGVDVVGIIDNRLQGEYHNCPVIGRDEDIAAICDLYGDAQFVVTPDNPAVRKRLVDRYLAHGLEFISLVHPSAFVSRSANIGRGVVIQILAHISANVGLGDFVRVNVGANIMHDCVIGDFVTVAPGAVLLGRVTVGDLAYVGSNATVLPDVRIGSGCVVGAGAVVTRDVADGQTVVGNPARALRGSF